VVLVEVEDHHGVAQESDITGLKAFADVGAATVDADEQHVERFPLLGPRRAVGALRVVGEPRDVVDLAVEQPHPRAHADQQDERQGEEHGQCLVTADQAGDEPPTSGGRRFGDGWVFLGVHPSPADQPLIMPAPTVTPVASSIKMNEPVARFLA
jgi:hypothetical protein